MTMMMNVIMKQALMYVFVHIYVFDCDVSDHALRCCAMCFGISAAALRLC